MIQGWQSKTDFGFLLPEAERIVLIRLDFELADVVGDESDMDQASANLRGRSVSSSADRGQSW